MPDTYFPRMAGLPAYILGAVDEKKEELRAQGRVVYDFGLGNPDLPSPPLAVEALREAARQGQNHRYQPSPGLRVVKDAIVRWYARHYGVTLDPVNEVVVTIGSKEGLGHLALAVLGAGDVVLAPDPCYPVHRFGPQFAGATVQPVPTAPGRDPLADLEAAYQAAPKPPKLAIINYPHNPTSATVDEKTLAAIVRWAEKRDLWLVSDLAYADLVYSGQRAPSALAVEGARARTVEFFSMSKSYNMAGWRVGFCVGNSQLVGALRRIKGYMDYGIFGAIQHAVAATLDGGDTFVHDVRETYRRRAKVLCDGLRRAGWAVDDPVGSMFVWAPVPERFRGMNAVDFAIKLLDEAQVAVAPGVAFGPGGEGYVRLALVEEAERIEAATQSIARMFR
ncbi:MAG TPA: aminotransferase class I/II-fold pyridoxal phosphate-dependent enzyme [Polyangia bacterium]|jgi:alanine-synthesizing transaminase|nr:aminotransferase class I/II-fold pyridoxal phosphate-dependent enzyme [Polyangia bacterium]